MIGPGTLRWYWYRMRAMDSTEIADRVLAKARQWTEQSASRVLIDFDTETPVDTCPQLPDRRDAPDSLLEAISDEAASIRGGQWLLFGWNEVQVPDPPIWHRDYMNGLETPIGVKSRHLNHRLGNGADARCVWETNRWGQMVSLAQNAWLNGVLDDARLAQRWLLDWCEKNPRGMGINWCSTLEAGLRLVNFCWIDALVRGCDDSELTTVQSQLAQQVVPSHAWWAWRYRSFGSSANDHLIGELAGLVLAARRWPSLARVTCSGDHAWELMSSEVLRQFAEDGGNREQALHYHHFALELGWQAQRVMVGARRPSAERLGEAARFFCDLVHEREPWHFGDSDDAHVTPLTFRRCTALAEWRAWLLGQEQGAALRFWLGEPPPQVFPVRAGEWGVYPLTGLAVQEVNDWKARVDGSPLGFGRMAAHGHLDAMHLSLWDGERALVVDPGTGAYYGDPEVRTKLASWELHNGALPLSGRARPHRAGPFIWVDHHPAPHLVLNGEGCLVRFVWDGHSVERTVRYSLDADAWVVTDQTEDEQPHVVRWRLAPEWHMVSRRASELTIGHVMGGAVQLTVESDDLIGCEVGEDMVSPHFGDLRRGLVITVTFTRRVVSHWQRLIQGGHP
jgi:hypothetical protein